MKGLLVVLLGQKFWKLSYFVSGGETILMWSNLNKQAEWATRMSNPNTFRSSRRAEAFLVWNALWSNGLLCWRTLCPSCCEIVATERSSKLLNCWTQPSFTLTFVEDKINETTWTNIGCFGFHAAAWRSLDPWRRTTARTHSMVSWISTFDLVRWVFGTANQTGDAFPALFLCHNWVLSSQREREDKDKPKFTCWHFLCWRACAGDAPTSAWRDACLHAAAMPHKKIGQTWINFHFGRCNTN